LVIPKHSRYLLLRKVQKGAAGAGLRIRYRKSSLEEKSAGKITYPPPADGLCVRFLCKHAASANNPASHAGRGASQAIDHCTVCKLLK
jgi:hypothetical protein